MNRKGSVLKLLSLLMLISCSSQLSTGSEAEERVVAERMTTYPLGDSTVQAVLHTQKGSDLFLFNMHDDENTAVDAALSILAERGGQLLELQHSGQRLVQFSLEAKTYTFDPNRMFTDQGARNSLRRYGSYSEEAFNAVRTFATDLLDDFGLVDRPLIITVHNNTEGEYSCLSYMSGEEYGSDAADVYFQPGSDADDFFFVTDPLFFDFFEQMGANTVLQDNDQATDDGSLSVLAGRQGIPYINVEAQHGHQEQQADMLRLVYDAVSVQANP